MDKDKVLLQLFNREAEPQALVNKETLIPTQMQSREYRHWLEGKRELTLDDVVGNHWIKTCTGGYITEVVFHCDGTLDEYRLFDRFHTTGKWTLKQGLVSVEIYKGENTYSFSVVGNAEINIHSAVEHKNGELHSYLKLSQIK
ncbi:hypothetical protein L1D13_07805 [Vibrio tubiashii]|uniref:hypothetical protein n=1 Tax=Vibrio tubiashii TaxID=29498 RepID=UPI001EFD22D7|nr:hypothetical protein [Vibrio tubiashii]MCG9580259.1 hypothetical protein [Vibrio tubiashii]MCG9613850.1 hypothetical protein [Vibrio tubiashii]MCG9686827.1 hypothetical protein [Vibrio tubiashii]